MTDIKTTVRRYIEEDILMGGASSFADSDSFIDHRIVDSTGFLEIIAFLEDTYGLVVADDEMLPQNLGSLDHIDAYVQRKLAA